MYFFSDKPSKQKRYSTKPKRDKIQEASDDDVGYCSYGVFRLPSSLPSVDALDRH